MGYSSWNIRARLVLLSVPSLCIASLMVGKDKFGFGFGGTGKKSTCSQFDDYGVVCAFQN